MLTALVVLLRRMRLICSGHRAVALENLALRQQVAVLRRTLKRPRLPTRDRLFWILSFARMLLSLSRRCFQQPLPTGSERV